MLIDWFTVIAQAVNFLILVWLLKRFLYQPILNAIDAREQRIAAELADADAKKAEAQAEREEFRRKNAEFDQQHAALLNQATEEASAERQRLFDTARRDMESLRAKQQDKLRNEYQSLHEEIARRTRVEVFAIARKTLTDLSGASLEAQMLEVFVQRLRGLDVAEKTRLASALQSSTAPVLVRSAFELSAAQRATIENAVKETLTAGTQVRFELASNLVSGIELTLQGQKIAWSIADYLASLDKSVNELLKAQLKADAGSEPR
jgi:F-type H+-transporting ATPase subunit b